MPRKCVAMPPIDIMIAQLIGNKIKKKRQIAATLVFVCTGHITDDEVASQRFNSKHIILSCVI